MENITRKNKTRTALEAGVRLDSSATHFKNNKLSENLGSTLDTLFRKKNLARISQRNKLSQTKKDFEYLQAVKQLVKLEHQKHRDGPSTSASTKRHSDSTKAGKYGPGTASQFATKPDLVSNQTGSRGFSKKVINIREPSPHESHSDSSAVLSDLSDSSDENDQTAFSTCRRKKKKNGSLGHTGQGSNISAKDPCGYDREGNTRSAFQPLRHGTAIRHTGHIVPTKQERMSKNFVYDPGDVYLVSRGKNHQPMFPQKKRRLKTALGFASSNSRSGKETVESRQCQSAGLSRRKLRDMNNIDALIESSDTPIFMDANQLLLENNKQYYKSLQTRVNTFLISIDDFKKRSAHKKDMALFFLAHSF